METKASRRPAMLGLLAALVLGGTSYYCFELVRIYIKGYPLDFPLELFPKQFAAYAYDEHGTTHTTVKDGDPVYQELKAFLTTERHNWGIDRYASLPSLFGLQRYFLSPRMEIQCFEQEYPNPMHLSNSKVYSIKVFYIADDGKKIHTLKNVSAPCPSLVSALPTTQK